eukprot:s3924_g7.t1
MWHRQRLRGAAALFNGKSADSLLDLGGRIGSASVMVSHLRRPLVCADGHLRDAAEEPGPGCECRRAALHQQVYETSSSQIGGSSGQTWPKRSLGAFRRHAGGADIFHSHPSFGSKFVPPWIRSRGDEGKAGIAAASGP